MASPIASDISAFFRRMFTGMAAMAALALCGISCTSPLDFDTPRLTDSTSVEEDEDRIPVEIDQEEVENLFFGITLDDIAPVDQGLWPVVISSANVQARIDTVDGLVLLDLSLHFEYDESNQPIANVLGRRITAVECVLDRFTLPTFEREFYMDDSPETPIKLQIGEYLLGNPSNIVSEETVAASANIVVRRIEGNQGDNVALIDFNIRGFQDFSPSPFIVFNIIGEVVMTFKL